MITGDEVITSGDAYINQISIKNDIKKVGSNDFFKGILKKFLKKDLRNSLP